MPLEQRSEGRESELCVYLEEENSKQEEKMPCLFGHLLMELLKTD